MEEERTFEAANRWRTSRMPLVARRAVQLAVVWVLVAMWISPAAARRGGILGQRAPALGVSTWFNLPAGKSSVDIPELKGKVIVLFFFQSW